MTILTKKLSVMVDINQYVMSITIIKYWWLNASAYNKCKREGSN